MKNILSLSLMMLIVGIGNESSIEIGRLWKSKYAYNFRTLNCYLEKSNLGQSLNNT
jgi:hypothetical protein